ncbi:type II/IV secretion system protein [Candidatus Poribacteria bacterium]|nr:type II/IV secretion system protein [Candidatus Poribacteria bacterium]
MLSMSSKSLLDILNDAGMLTEDELQAARAQLEAARASDESEEEILRAYASESEIAMARRAKEMGAGCISLRDRPADPEATERMLASYAYKQRVVPVTSDNGTLYVAMEDPLDVELVDEIRLVTGSDVHPLLADASDIEDAIRRYYGKSAEALIRGDLSGPAGAVALEAVEDIHDYGLQADDLVRSPTVRHAVDQIIIDAVRASATDIHVEPFEREVQIRYRIDGVLEQRPSPPKHLQSAVISRIKLMANMNIAETRRPQDGHIARRISSLGRREIDMRISTVPTVHGESVAMRILDKNVISMGLAQLGLMDDNLDDFRRMIRKPWGIVLATGPTGSGKTTTLNACLKEINDIGSKIITIEDPVEYEIEGINQINIHTEIGVTFAAALRHILRQDPDIVMVGEIRDFETAEMAIHTSLTGHLVFSSLHTNDAPSAMTRLVAMGIDPYLVASTLEGVIAQRLPRRICRSCSRGRVPTTEELEAMGIEPDLADPAWRVPIPVGCPECRNTGYRGRIGIFEVIVMNEALRDMAVQHASVAQVRRSARKFGMRTLREDGWRKALAGITSVEEVRRLTPEEDESQAAMLGAE